MKHLISVVILSISIFPLFIACKQEVKPIPQEVPEIDTKVADSVMIASFTKYGISESSIKGLDKLKKGDVAPDFKAKNQSGEDVFLSKMLSQGPVVLVFYRGNWCSYCSQYLASFVEELAALKDLGVQVVAVAPEPAAKQALLANELSSEITFIADPLNRIMYRYGVAFKVSDAYNERFSKGKGTTIAQNNEQEIAIIPIPATYVIAKDGKIKWLHFDPDYSKRPLVSEIVAQFN